MVSRGKELLTRDQRTEFVRISSDIPDRELEIYYTFSQLDLENIKRHRRDHNRLGFAVQLCVLRYPGWSLSDVEPIPDFVIKYIAKQIDANPDSFSLYAQRDPTKHEHMEEIRQVYGYQNFSTSKYREKAQFLLQHALQNGKVMPWDKIVTSVEEAKKLARPMDYDYLDLLENRFTYLRKYSPTLLKSLEFRSTKAAETLLRALKTLNEMNESGKRKVPDGAPLDFVPKRWKKHVYDEEGTINRHYYEMAALTELKNHIRSGDVSVVVVGSIKTLRSTLFPKMNGQQPILKKLDWQFVHRQRKFLRKEGKS